MEEVVKSTGPFNEYTLSLLRQLRYPVVVFAVAVGTLYQIVFWEHFDVNVLAYIGWLDVVKSSAVPLALFFGMTVISSSGFAFGVAIGRSHRRRAVRERSQAPSMSALVVRYCMTIAWLAAVALLFWYAYLEKSLLVYLSGIAAAVVCIVTRETGFLRQVTPAAFRYSLVTTVLIAPMLAIVLAMNRAEAVLDGRSYHAAELSVESIQASNRLLSFKELRYLGHVNDFEFFWAGGTTIAVPVASIKVLSFQRVRVESTTWDVIRRRLGLTEAAVAPAPGSVPGKAAAGAQGATAPPAPAAPTASGSQGP